MPGITHRRNAAEKHAYRAGFNTGSTLSFCEGYITESEPPYYPLMKYAWLRFMERNGLPEHNDEKLHFELGFECGHRGDPPAEEWA